MQEIKCPNCGTVFQVDESEYAQILRQVRDEEFKKELEYRAKDLEEKKKTDVQLVRMERRKNWEKSLHPRLQNWQKKSG